MDRKQGLELVELFFDRVADRFGLQAIYSIPSLEGQPINLLKATDPTKGTDELFQLARDPYGSKSIAYAMASNFRTAMIRHLHNQHWEIVCRSYATLFDKNVDPDLISFTLSSFKHMIETLQYPANNNPNGEPFIPKSERLFNDYLVNIEESRDHEQEAINGIIWEVMSDLQEITQKSQDLHAAALQAIAGDHAFDGKTVWDKVPDEKFEFRRSELEKILNDHYKNKTTQDTPINWISALLKHTVIEPHKKLKGKYSLTCSITTYKAHLHELCRVYKTPEPSNREMLEVIRKKDGSEYNPDSFGNIK